MDDQPVEVEAEAPEVEEEVVPEDGPMEPAEEQVA